MFHKSRLGSVVKIYVYVCMCMHVCIYVHMRVYAYLYASVCFWVCIHNYKCKGICVYIYIATSRATSNTSPAGTHPLHGRPGDAPSRSRKNGAQDRGERAGKEAAALARASEPEGDGAFTSSRGCTWHHVLAFSAQRGGAQQPEPRWP